MMNHAIIKAPLYLCLGKGAFIILIYLAWIVKKLRQLLFSFLFCSVFVHAPHEEFTHCKSSYEYNDAGNIVALKICMKRTMIPVVDGMRFEWQKQEHVIEKIFPIHNQMNIAEHEHAAHEDATCSQITKPEIIPSFKAAHIAAQPLPQKPSSGCFAGIQITQHQPTAIELMSNQELLQLMLYNRYCLTWYHMSSAQKYNMMSLGYKKFEQKLLQDQTLQDWAVWELWQEYQHKRLWNVGDKKGMYEKSIADALESRKKHHQQEAEALFLKIVEAEKVKAQQDLLQKHKVQRLRQGEIVQASFQNLQDFTNQHAIACDDFLKTCQDKLLTSQQQCYEQYEMNYELDDRTRGYLLYKNIDYKELETFVGTDLQQEFHLQTCNILKDAALLQSKLFDESQLLTGACHVGVAAHEANKHEWADVTGALCMIGSKLVKSVAAIIDPLLPYCLAVGEGVFESGYDFIHMVLNPRETLYGIGKLIYFVLETAAIAEAYADLPNNPEVADQMDQRLTEISTGLAVLIAHGKEMDGPARAKALTKFSADFFIPGKMTGACAHILGGVCLKAKILRKIEGIVPMLAEDFGAEHAFEYALEGAGKIAGEEGAFSEILTEFSEIGNHAAQTHKVARSFKRIMYEIRTIYNGVIPPFRVDLKKELEFVLKEIQKGLKNAATEKIKNLYKRKVIDGKQVEILFDHIFEVEFKFKKCLLTGGHILDIKGGHLPGMCEKLEKFGIAKILKKKAISCGSVEYTMQNIVTGEIYLKTVFTWCEEKIARSLYEVYETGVIKYTKKKVPYKTKLIDGVDVSIFCKDSIARTSKGVIPHSKIVSAVPYGDIL